MSCSIDLKAYAVDELSKNERSVVEDHVRACQSCREELDRLTLTRSALASLEDEEMPRRIAFVSDRVFEPRWWQTMWHSGPAMGFSSAALLAAAILVHGFEARPVVSVPVVPSVDAAQIEKQVESQLSARVQAAVSQAQAKQSAEFAQVLNAATNRLELERQADRAVVQQAADYYRKQFARYEVASNVAGNQRPSQ